MGGAIEGLILGAGAVLVGHAQHSIMLESCRVKNPPFSGPVFLYKGKYYYHDLYIEKYIEAHKDSKLKNLKKLEADYLISSTDPLEDNAEYQRATLDAIQATIRLLDGTPEDIPPYEWKNASTIFASPEQPIEVMQPDEPAAVSDPPPISHPEDETNASPLPIPPQPAEQQASLQAKLSYVGEQLTALDLRMASRFDGEPTEDGIISAFQQNLITKEQAEQARERIRRNMILQEQDEAEHNSLIQQVAVLQAELDKLVPPAVQQTPPLPASSKKSLLTIVFGIASVVLLVAVIMLSVQLSDAKSASVYLAANANNYIRRLSEKLEDANNALPNDLQSRLDRLKNSSGSSASMVSFQFAYEIALKNAAQDSMPSIPSGSFCASVNGNIYHRSNCSILKGIPIPNLVFFQMEAEAKAAGFDGCPSCVK